MKKSLVTKYLRDFSHKLAQKRTKTEKISTKSHIFSFLFAATKKNAYFCDMKQRDNNLIIATLYQKGVIRDECQRFVPDKYLCDDLVNDVAIILMGKPSELIFDLFRKGEIVWYIRRIVKNQVCSQTSPFHKEYLKLDKNSISYAKDI